jgi:glycosyltransferase involved in cell wall biosynthesis
MIAERDADKFAVKIIELMNDQKMLKSLSAKSRKIAEMYTWDNCAKQTLEVYEKVL